MSDADVERKAKAARAKKLASTSIEGRQSHADIVTARSQAKGQSCKLNTDPFVSFFYVCRRGERRSVCADQPQP